MSELQQFINKEGIDEKQIETFVDNFIAKYITGSVKKLLIVPPDYTRSYSRSGIITKLLYDKLHSTVDIKIMPAVGTHMAMSDKEIDTMYCPNIPKSLFLVHNFRENNVKLGTIAKEEVSKMCDGLFEEDIDVEVDRELVEGDYDLVVSVGQVVPHESVGFANYTKNIFVGCGGRAMINKTHLLGAVCGMEKALGQDHAPARKVYDYTEANFADKMLPIVYMLTVVSSSGDKLLGLFETPVGERTGFTNAVALSKECNVTYVDKVQKKVVVYLDKDKYKTTWLGNKSIYRTRMMIETGGEIVIIAPGVHMFGEGEEVDAMIRKIGYRGREHILNYINNATEESSYMEMAAGHLIRGSSEGRFSVSYATNDLTKEEIELVGYNYLAMDEAMAKYQPEKLVDGFNTLADGEEVYFVSNPALGLWVSADKR